MMSDPKVGAFMDDAEEDLIRSVEELETRPASQLRSERRQEIETMARNTIKEEREKISMSISRSDLQRLKSRALQEGVSYQALIGSIIHKYLSS